jgi:dTMP kinase
MESKRGLYIVIEGGDGAGTTTQKDLAVNSLCFRGENAIGVSEPGETKIGIALRLIVKDATIERNPETDLDIFTIQRRELVDQIIKPTVEQGIHVVSDRNWFSTVAYQGYGEGLDYDLIYSKTYQAIGSFIVPDVAILIDVPIDVMEERIAKRGKDETETPDKFEIQDMDVKRRRREGYIYVAQQSGCFIIDGSKSIPQVNGEILEIIDSKLKAA